MAAAVMTARFKARTQGPEALSAAERALLAATEQDLGEGGRPSSRRASALGLSPAGVSPAGASSSRRESKDDWGTRIYRTVSRTGGTPF